jgi:hypothetical protein
LPLHLVPPHTVPKMQMQSRLNPIPPAAVGELAQMPGAWQIAAPAAAGHFIGGANA